MAEGVHQLLVLGSQAQADLLARALAAEHLPATLADEQVETEWGLAWRIAIDGDSASSAPDPKSTAVILATFRQDEPPAGADGVLQLARWRGSRDNRDFRDLLVHIRGELAGRSRRPVALRYSIFAVAALIPPIIGFSANLFGLQNEVCSLSIAQPSMSDFCGALSLGGKPTREERLAWARRPRRSCDALRQHIARFPDGAYASVAANLLEAAVPQRGAPVRSWRPAVGYVRASVDGEASEEAARARAARAAADDARNILCVARDAHERLAGIAVEPRRFDCRAAPGGTACALDYRAQCHFEIRPLIETCA